MRLTDRRNGLVLLTAWLLVSGVLGQLGSAPITAWGPGPILGSKANFETLPASQFLHELVSVAAGDAPTGSLVSLLSQEAFQEGRPQAVVIFVSSQPDAAAATPQLQALTSAAGSWLQLPNAVHQGQSSHVFKGLQQVASRVHLQVLGSCTGAPAVIPATADAIRQHVTLGATDAPTVAVICADGTEDEAQLLSVAQAVVAGLTDRYLMVHTIARQAASSQAQQRRRLLQSEGSTEYTECDAKCQIQVKYLEGFIVFVTVALAVSVGLCCMHIINTPTRFETPKELRSAGHHD